MEIQQWQQYQHLTAGTYWHISGHFKDNSRIRIEQNSDPVIPNLRHIVKKVTFDKNGCKTDSICKHYQQDWPKTEVRKDILVQKYFDDTGMISSHYHFFLTHQVLNELLHYIYGQSAKHPRFTKMIQAARQKYYYSLKTFSGSFQAGRLLL